MKIVVSAHALEESQSRKIPSNIIDAVLENPEQIVEEYGGKKAYQSKIALGSGKIYLVRIIVKEYVDHAVVVTAYKTSRIDKYWRAA